MQGQNLEADFNFYFKQDIFRLFQDFLKLKTYRFSDFVTLWNECKFYQLFSIPRFYPLDFRYLMKDILKITVEFLYDDELFKEVRTAALFTLFALYSHQINRPKMKIPVTPVQWVEILSFIDTINQAEHFDVEYVFRHLLHSDAFEFPSTFELTNPVHSLKNKSSGKPLSDENKPTSLFNMKSFKNDLINNELNEQMEEIHNEYLRYKKELADTDSIQTDTYIQPDLNELLAVDQLDQILEITEDKKEPLSAGARSSQAAAQDDNGDEGEESKPDVQKLKTRKKPQKPILRVKRNFQGLLGDDDKQIPEEESENETSSDEN